MAALKKAIGRTGKLAIGFSGGVDSSFLAKVAYEAIGVHALAITIDSELMPRREIAQAKNVARLIGIRHSIIKCEPLQDRQFAANPVDRCYYCKKDDVSALTAEAERNGIHCIAFGTTISDLSEYRPGMKACEELCVWQPLLELKFAKGEVRAEAKKMRRRKRLTFWSRSFTRN